MRKLLRIAGIAGAVGSAAAVAGLGTGASTADPTSSSTYNVVGEPYAKAVAILRAQGVKATFGGSVGSDVPQAQCIVSTEKVLATGKIQLELDCTAAAQPEKPAAPSAGTAPSSGAQQSPGAGNRPTPGAPGVVTVIPTQVG